MEELRLLTPPSPQKHHLRKWPQKASETLKGLRFCFRALCVGLPLRAPAISPAVKQERKPVRSNKWQKGKGSTARRPGAGWGPDLKEQRQILRVIMREAWAGLCQK